MSSATIYGTYLSPFVRKVELAMLFKGLEYQLSPVMPFVEAPEYGQLKNPMRKIPMFDDGNVTLSDSTVILGYLEDRHPSPPLMPAADSPQGAALKARALWYEEYSDTVLAELMVRGNFFELQVKPAVMGGLPDLEKVEDIRANKLPPHLDFLEKEVAGREHLIGDSFSVADLSFVSMLISASYGGYEVDSARWPELARYARGQLASKLFSDRLELEKPHAQRVREMAEANIKKAQS